MQRYLLAGEMSSEQRRSLDQRDYNGKVFQMRYQTLDPHILTRVAIWNGSVAGAAVWILRLGKHTGEHSLQCHVRTLTMQEHLMRMWIKAKLYFRAILPAFIKKWLWPVCEVDSLIQIGFSEVRQRRQELSKRWMHSTDTTQDYLILNLMNVLPEYERKGVGATLLKEGIEMARKANVPIYLLATPAGRGFYERHGFEALEVCEQGDEEILQWTETMMRWPAQWDSSSN